MEVCGRWCCTDWNADSVSAVTARALMLFVGICIPVYGEIAVISSVGVWENVYAYEEAGERFQKTGM